MHPRLEKIKTHVQENKAAYIVGAAGVVAVAGTVVVMRYVQSQATVTTDSFKLLEFKWQSPTTNNITVTLTPRGNLGNPVRCIETGQLFESQGFAAGVFGVNPGDMSKHLNGLRDHVGGFHFERIPWNAE